MEYVTKMVNFTRNSLFTSMERVLGTYRCCPLGHIIVGKYFREGVSMLFIPWEASKNFALLIFAWLWIDFTKHFFPDGVCDDSFQVSK